MTPMMIAPQKALFRMEPGTGKKIDWLVDFNSSLYLGPKNPAFVKSQEYYRYNIENFVGDFGSYLGLFLGWSILSIVGNVPLWFKRLTDCCKKKGKLIFGKEMSPRARFWHKCFNQQCRSFEC